MKSIVVVFFILVSTIALSLCSDFKPATVANSLNSTINSSQDMKCPLWHVRRKNKCECGVSFDCIVACQSGADSITVGFSRCMTWDKETDRAVVHHCPLSYNESCPHCLHVASVTIPTNVSGVELNTLTCSRYNRKGTLCKECKDGYGPAPFSDGFTCANCSKYKHLWVLYLFLELAMVTVLYLVVILFQIKGTSSPLHIIITYSQLCICPLSVSIGVRVRMSKFLGPTLTTVVMTVIGVSNLDFFRFVMPPMCISTSLKSINILLLDYIVAFYPIILTLIIYICIKLYDRNCLLVICFTVPVKWLFQLFKRNWNPKTTILNACVTFILLAYSKLLFTSVNLLFGVRSYNSEGEVVPGSTVLLYDPTIKFFHAKHIPYVVLALSVIVVFVILPPLLLLLYPTRLFKNCLNCCRYRRWDILQLIADIFQGWYKDGTGSTPDFRALSVLYFVMRIVLSSLFILLMFFSYNYRWCIVGVFHVFLGMFFFVAKPYKKDWMNCIDGLVLLWIGVILLANLYENKAVFLCGIVLGVVLFVVAFLPKFLQKLRTQSVH